MATDITASIGVQISSTMQKTTAPTAPGGATTLETTSADPYNETEQSDYTFGTGSGKAKGHLHGIWSCGAAAQIIFDLNNVLADAFGDTIVATEIKAIYLHNLSTTTGDLLEVLGDAAGTAAQVPFMLAAADAFNLHPNGVLLMTSPVDGWAVGAGATDNFEIDNNQAGAISFELYVLYEHA